MAGSPQLSVPVQFRAVSPGLVAVHEQPFLLCHCPRQFCFYVFQCSGRQLLSQMQYATTFCNRAAALPHTTGGFRVPVQRVSHGKSPPYGAVR